MNVADIELRLLKAVKEKIGHDSERAMKYAEALVDVAAQSRLSGSLAGVDGPDPAEMRCAMLEQCAKAVGSDRNIAARYARAARTMAMYERIVAGAQFSIQPDGSISVTVRRKP